MVGGVDHIYTYTVYIQPANSITVYFVFYKKTILVLIVQTFPSIEYVREYTVYE